MKKIVNFFKKHYKKFVTVGVVVAVIVAFGFYITEPYSKLLTYIMQKYGWGELGDLDSESKVEIKMDTLDGASRYYQIHNEKGTDFKILQLTDLHIGGSRASYINDIKAIDAMYELIEYTKPDFIVLTGDMLFVSLLSRNVNNMSAAVDLKMFMSNIGIPWTMVFGNHDAEFYNLYNNSELRNIFKAGEESLLLWPTKIVENEDDFDQVIVLYDGDSVNTAFFLMDSEHLVEKPDVSLDWYERVVDKVNEKYQKNVPSMLFMHYPLYEYSLAYDLYEEKSDAVELIYGKKREEICYEERTNFFDKIVEKNSTKAIFVGHDHLNDFSLNYKGIRLTYGKSIDYITYKGIANMTEQRGGTLITIKPDSTFEITPIKLEDIK